MTGPLSTLGRSWQDLVEHTADFQSELLRRTAADMAAALDRSAMRDVEGSREWRDIKTDRRFCDDKK